eukprot:14029470-Alexandrium_andersonii.AAC.1
MVEAFARQDVRLQIHCDHLGDGIQEWPGKPSLCSKRKVSPAQRLQLGCVWLLPLRRENLSGDALEPHDHEQARTPHTAPVSYTHLRAHETSAHL